MKKVRRVSGQGTKSFLVTDLLCMFLGGLGIHRFYTGYVGIGIAQLFTLGGCGIWTTIDFFSINLGKFKDAKNMELKDYNKKVGTAFIVVIAILWLLSGSSFAASIASLIQLMQGASPVSSF